MPEIIPNWHPFFVHFTVGLLFTATLFYVISGFLKNPETSAMAKAAGLWMLWAGVGFTVFTVASGIYAFGSVAHDDPAHLAMKDHRLWALITAAFFTFLGIWSFLMVRKDKELPRYFSLILIVGVALLSMTGLKGADLVYRHGLGVMSLPETEGEGHSHEEGEGHDEAAMEDTAPPADLSNFDTTTPAGTVNAFSAALRAGDGEAARSFLDDQVLIYESGYVERSAEEYAGHHMPADMKFVGAMTNELLAQTETISGDMATVVSESSTKGTYNDKDYNLLGTGTMVLRRDGEGWKITHIHWSS
ncbi:MAG: DUF2231 domain-containing protein, partial [Sphingomonadales bacterium]